ncbi:MAG: UDP-N-acetylmuramate:L-alanyl-gamma-D-glutamyl-meso-diaminopimelate ligase [Ghiorsea sp.]|nr:UDP-N-acetylmuramate:L-alanyl-gamma-D-glutamyl-meso-diaminopimelate ligase [Ghiorsea sp.]
MIKHLHVLGVCGTAMAAITSLAKAKGWRVTGSDAHVYPPMSTYLESMGVSIATFSEANLKPTPDLCLIGNAMSRGNVEVEYILNHDLPYMSGPEFMGRYILPQRHAAVVAGTHGKTSTSSLLAWILEVAGKAPGFMIGGIPENFGQGARIGQSSPLSPFILEGDEYDTAFFDKRSKFIHYHAKTLILNNLEFDHADIFKDLEAIKTQFCHLLRTIPESGTIIANADDANIMDVVSRGVWTPVTTFAELGTDADWQWQALEEDGSSFKLYHQGKPQMQVTWDSIGKHHAANACAVAAAATSMGISLADIKKGFESFKGVRKRMTKVGQAHGITIYDDFAHHPTAIKGIVDAVKSTMKGLGKLWVVLEPRSNTMRTNIHQDRLPDSLLSADHVIFTPPSERNIAKKDLLDVNKVCKTLQNNNIEAKVIENTQNIIEIITQHAKKHDIILILSNGGFENIHQRLLNTLK